MTMGKPSRCRLELCGRDVTKRTDSRVRLCNSLRPCSHSSRRRLYSPPQSRDLELKLAQDQCGFCAALQDGKATSAEQPAAIRFVSLVAAGITIAHANKPAAAFRFKADVVDGSGHSQSSTVKRLDM